jgi:parvulin-like peptidyl-prolyl isomerase
VSGALAVGVAMSAPLAAVGADTKGATEVVLKVGDRSVTAAELEAALSYEPSPILDRMRTDDNFARTFAVRWYEAELFAKAAADDGVIAQRPGLADAARNLGRNLISDEYTKYVLEAEFAPSDVELQSYYTMNKERCVEPARYHLARIGVQIAKNASEQEKAGANQRLAAMRERLAKGESFAIVADEMSDLPAKAEGGDVGWISDDDLGKEEGVAAIRTLAVGQMTEPVQTRRGLEIFRMVEKQDAKTLSLEACKPKLVAQINSEYLKAAARRRTDELAKRYNASMNLDAFVAAARRVQGGRMVEPKGAAEKSNAR